MARHYSQNVPKPRNVVAILAIALLAAAISAFQYVPDRLQTGLAAISRRQSGLRKRAVVDDVRNRELQQILKPSGAPPRGLFDPLYSGLSADAAAIDAAICRRARLW
jgi:hypothetical protein